MFPTALQQFQFYDKYSRFSNLLGRRETWKETVDRSVDYLIELSENKLGNVYTEIRDHISGLESLPSLRLMAMAGEAARRTSVSCYNCSYLEVSAIDSFVEALLLSMGGCGVGFSVESRCVSQLPYVVPQHQSLRHMAIEDTTEGWGEALRLGLESWFSGYDVIFDYSHIRPAGSILRVKGGRASGPDPLREMLQFIRSLIIGAQGRKLRPLEAHDIMCKVGDAAVMGGTRRTAMISLFDLGDQEMLTCKHPGNIEGNEQRWNANNSAVWIDKMGRETVEEFMGTMYDGMVGEPGIFSRSAAVAMMPERRDKGHFFGTNPCGEIVLRPNQLCNLSVAVARYDASESVMAERVRIASVIGTIQSMATHFPGFRDDWQKNCEEERLLGVDITGHMDSPIVRNPAVLRNLRGVAVQTNAEYAKILGINPSASVTCVKPSGNSSVLLNCSSGIHGRWSPYYIRNVRVGATSPIYKMFRDQGVPMSPENGQTADNARTWVVHFPVASPEGAITRNDLSAMQQCEYWKIVKLNWTEHNPSVTITYQEDEREALTDWVYENQAIIGGMSFLPRDDAKYTLPPNQPINKAEYEKLTAAFPKIDFRQLFKYEDDDMTTSAQELACVAGNCDI